MRRLGVALLVLRLPGRMDRRHVEATFASCYRERKGANVVALASLTFRSMMSHEDLARICESQRVVADVAAGLFRTIARGFIWNAW